MIVVLVLLAFAAGEEGEAFQDESPPPPSASSESSEVIPSSPIQDSTLASMMAPVAADIPSSSANEAAPILTPAAWRTRMRECRQEREYLDKRRCMDSTAALLPTLPGSQEIIDYFFEAKPYPGVRIRTPACKSKAPRGGKIYQGDIVWRAGEPPAGDATTTTDGEDDVNHLPCLWGNMPFGKSIEILLFARNLGITHFIESGRMGGLSLVHYAHFGYNLTSVELLPVPHVEASIRRLQPHTKILNGDGMKLVPEALSRILSDNPAAKVLVIIDGPKDRMAIDLARQILRRAVLVVLDDQAVKQNIGGPACTSASKTWRHRFPMHLDRAVLMKPPNPPKAYSWDARFYCRENDVATFVLGGADF